MKYCRFLFIIVIFLLSFLFVEPGIINAVDCSPTTNGAIFTVSASCSFAGTTDGVDYGTGAVNTAVLEPETGATITVSAGQTLATGSIDLIGDGSFVIINTGQIKLNTPLYITDADADSYPANNSQYLASGAGKVRRSTLVSISSLDCDDVSASIYPGTACGGGICTICSTSGSCDNQTSAQDLFNQCPDPGTCQTGGNCNGSGACTGIGYTANGLTGINCTALHYRCNGAGSCTAPIVESGCVGAASGHDANWKCITYLGYDMCRRSYGYADVCGGGCYSCQAAQQGCDVPFYSAVCANYVYD